MNVAGTIPHPLPDWHAIHWRKVYRCVRRLQARIVKAVREGRWGKAHALRRILTRSLSAACLAVRRVTETRGKKTPGVDGVIWSTPKAKQKAVLTTQQGNYTPLPLRRVYIDKDNGRRRPLGIPAMQDRAKQAYHGLALDPIAECLADPNSYAYRRERSPADAIAQCFNALARSYSPQWALKGDITACFDRLGHEWMCNHVPMDRGILKKWLKAGYIERKTFHETEEGTPQGSNISPILCNLALDGLERELKRRFKRRKVNLIRFADDIVATGESEEFLRDEVKPVMVAFLAERGVTLSEEKTRIVPIEEGFDFLGQNVRKYNGKLIIKPSKKAVKKVLEKVRGILKKNATAKASRVIKLLNPVIRGWANYHRHVCSKKTFGKVDSQIWQAVWRWAKRRHPQKSKGWIKTRYFTTQGGDHWVFFGKDEEGREVHLFNASSTPIQRQIKVKGEANPYDPAYEAYFEERLSEKWAAGQYGNGKAKRLWQIQKGKCPTCGQPVTEEMGWQVHHQIPRVEGGPDTLDNLVLLHPNCHRQLHAQEKPRTSLVLERGL